MRQVVFGCAALLLAWSMGVAHADTLRLPTGSAQEDTMAGEVPVRGQSMQQVTARFGEPLQKLPAVGEPPITRWVYPDYTVYFEHQYVIHSVRKPTTGGDD